MAETSFDIVPGSLNGKLSKEVRITENPFVAPDNGIARLEVISNNGAGYNCLVTAIEDGSLIWNRISVYQDAWSSAAAVFYLRKGHSYTFSASSPGSIWFTDNRTKFYY